MYAEILPPAHKLHYESVAPYHEIEDLYNRKRKLERALERLEEMHEIQASVVTWYFSFR